MSRSRRPVLIVALRLVITLLFVPAILDKFMDPREWARLFTTWGYPPWSPVVISVIEIIGLAVLWIPAAATWGSVAIMITTAGATGTWLIRGPASIAAYPGTIFVLVAVHTWLHQVRARASESLKEVGGAARI